VELSTARWPDVAAAPRRVLVVPVGSTEQHGPHLPLDTDTRIAAAVAARACAALPGSGLGLAPAIPIGASGEHAGFPGTLSIGTVALSTLLVELGRHASAYWPAMLVVNGHGGNADAISSAIAQLRAEGRACHVWHAGLKPPMLAALLAALREAAAAAGAVPGAVPAAASQLVPDAHAGRVETSLMLAVAPDDVRLAAAQAGDTRPLRELLPALRAHGTRGVTPNGVLGDPAGASAAEGRLLLDQLTADLTAVLRALLA
jgi:creatinine amidohydrolase